MAMKLLNNSWKCQKVNMKKTSTAYRLRDKRTGKFAMMSISYNDDGEYCGENTYKIEEYGDRIYEVNELSKAIRCLHFDQSWYNSSETHTVIDECDRSNLEIVKIVFTETVTVPTYDQPIIYKNTHNTIDNHNQKLPGNTHIYGNIPKEHTFESFRKFVKNKTIHQDTSTKRTVIDVVKAKAGEEYEIVIYCNRIPLGI